MKRKSLRSEIACLYSSHEEAQTHIKEVDLIQIKTLKSSNDKINEVNILFAAVSNEKNFLALKINFKSI